MTTLRDIVSRAFRRAALRDSSSSLNPDDARAGLEELQDILLSLPGATWWTDVDVAADYTAGENERVRVNSDDAVTVTIPSAVSSAKTILFCCGQVTVVCEGQADRAPKDGARVQIVNADGTFAATYAFRADLGQWIRADSLGLTDEVPINADLQGGLTAMLALRLLSLEPNIPPSQMLIADAQSGAARMRARYGKRQAVAVDTMLTRTSGPCLYL